MNHAEFAWHNYRLADRCASVEWRAVLYYYAGLHAVNHLLFAPGVSPRLTHEERRKRIVGHPRVYELYFALEQLSWVARYQPWMHPIDPGDVYAAGPHSAAGSRDTDNAEHWALELMNLCCIPAGPTRANVAASDEARAAEEARLATKGGRPPAD